MTAQHSDLQTYLVEPHAPLVFRSGRPFGSGARDGANFPWPQAWAGLLRAQYLRQHGLDPAREPAHHQQLLRLAAKGPFLVRHDGNAWSLCVPRPRDALLVQQESGRAKPVRRVPLETPDAGIGMDLPDGLLPLTLDDDVEGKPARQPAFWGLTDFVDWATATAAIDTARFGFDLPTESRTHVAIAPDTFASVPGALFQTEALDLGPRRAADAGKPTRYAFAGYGPRDLDEGLLVFGGERRLSSLTRGALDLALALPAGLRATMSAAQRFAVTLITPGLFAHGWRPGWLGDDLVGRWPGIDGLTVRLRAACVERWQPVSGWALAERVTAGTGGPGIPKPTRRAVPAGCTYWFEVCEGTCSADALWLASMADDEQDRRDGYALVLPRPWPAIAAQSDTV